jgi:hypothetical protein
VIVLSNLIFKNPFLCHAEAFGVFLLKDTIKQPKTTLNNGYLGSRNDEERSEMRYVM